MTNHVVQLAGDPTALLVDHRLLPGGPLLHQGVALAGGAVGLLASASHDDT